MASSAEPITIDRAYLETLVRRANFNNGEETLAKLSANALAEQDMMVIPRLTYENLMLVAHQFAALRSNMMAGGIDESTITLLSQDQPVTNQSIEVLSCQQLDHAARFPGNNYKPTINCNVDPHFSSAKMSNQHEQHRNHDTKYYNADGDDYSAEYLPDAPAPDLQQRGAFKQLSLDRPHYSRMCKRTIVLTGIPTCTTHEDVTRAVRGGLLLELYIRAQDHSALVSFLCEEDAVRFYDHSRKNDLYINHKRIFIKWADRHFRLADHVAAKIAQGATRNMIVRRCSPHHTEETIRDDLEHIHNLVVVKIEFIGGSCYIKTNSVHNAMFARTCMMSRAKYKGSKVEWDVDECEQPLESVSKVQRVVPKEKPAVKMRNRFATLRLDDHDNGSDDGFDTSDGSTA